MTKQEVIEFMDSQRNAEGASGYMIVAVSEEDMAIHADAESYRAFMAKTPEQREAVLSNVADELQDWYENGEFSQSIDNVLMDNGMK